MSGTQLSSSRLSSQLTLTTTLEGLRVNVSIFWVWKLRPGQVAQGHFAKT